MKRIIITFGILAVVLLLLTQLGKYSLFVLGPSNEVMLGIWIVLLVGFGVVVSRYLFLKNNPSEVASTANLDLDKVKALGISDREYEVLQHLARGLSNKEIANTLFISESTVKTHVSNLLGKLDAKRRTQAVSKAKELNLIDL